jgi:radical SAM protein with 4Fe4S-binding SPASM domain
MSAPPRPPGSLSWKDGPTRAWIVTTSKCNLNCTHCARSIEDFRAVAEATPDMAGTVFDRFERQVLPTLRTIQFGGTNLGEPMMVPTIADHVRRVRAQPEIREIKVQTNGTYLLKPERLEALVREGVRFLVSLEGVTPSSYQAVRGVEFDVLLRGLERLKALRAQYPESGSDLKLSFTVRYDTLPELIPLVELGARVGASQVSVTHFVPMKESQRYQSLCYHRGASNAAIAAAEARAHELGLRFVGPTPFELSAMDAPSGPPAAPARREPPCRHPWTSVSINERGDVSPCCATGAVMGNLTRQDFATIWHSKRYRTLRARVNSARPPWYCQGCVLRGVDMDSPDARFHTDEGYLLRGIGGTSGSGAQALTWARVRRSVAERLRATAARSAFGRRAVALLRAGYWRLNA